MFLGLESLDAEQLKLFRKRTTPNQNFEALEVARKLGIDVAINLITDPSWTVEQFELPSPGEDLLQQSEQLCAFIGRQQRPDGSLSYLDVDLARQSGTPGVAEDPDGINYYPGEALYGLMRSQQRRRK